MAIKIEHDWFPRPIPENVRIGEGTYFDGSYCLLHYASQEKGGIVIGDHCGIYIGTFFELGKSASVHIGDYSAIVGAIISTNDRVKIGSYCFIAHEVVIADTCFACPLSQGEGSKKTLPQIEIGDNVWIGTRAVILGGAKIGEGSVIGAAAVVDFEVPAYSVVVGNPAKIVKSLI